MSSHTHRQQAVVAELAHGVEGALAGGGLEVLELPLPVVVQEPPLQRLAAQLGGGLDLYDVRVAVIRKKYILR